MIRMTYKFQMDKLKLNGERQVEAKLLVTTYWFLFIPLFSKKVLLGYERF